MIGHDRPNGYILRKLGEFATYDGYSFKKNENQ